MPLAKRETAIELKTVSDASGMEEITEGWSALCLQCGATPFQSPEWLIPWWRHFGGDNLLKIFILEKEGVLSAVAPLFIDRQTGVLKFIGSGITDYLDFIAQDERELKILLEYIYGDDGWSGCELQDMPAWSKLFSAGAGFLEKRQECETCPYIELPEAENLRAVLKGRWGYGTFKAERMMSRQGEVVIEKACEENLESIMLTLFRLNIKEWKTRNATSVLESDRVMAFHMEASRGLLRAGALRVYRMLLNGVEAAVIYSFMDKERLYSYLSSFNPELARYSPGRVIILHAIKEAIREGAKEFDFLRGAEPYKYTWGARDRMTYKARLKRPG